MMVGAMPMFSNFSDVWLDETGDTVAPLLSCCLNPQRHHWFMSLTRPSVTYTSQNQINFHYIMSCNIINIINKYFSLIFFKIYEKSSQLCTVLQHRQCSSVTASIRFNILLLAFKALHEFVPDSLWTLPLSHTSLALRSYPTARLTNPHRTLHSQR